MKLTGKRVVITGASSGIGLLLMRRLFLKGARVIGVARDVRKIENEFGGKSAIACDVSKPKQIDAMIAQARERLGGIDVFVSNAGCGHFGPSASANWEKTEELFQTNVFSSIYTLSKLSEQEESVVFMVTVSALSKMALPGFALYNATKFALDGFLRSYRMEKPDNVRVVPVYPVANHTPFFCKAGGADMPVPLVRQSAIVTAAAMENGLRYNMRAVYPSLLFVVHSLLSRLLPMNIPVQAVEKARYRRWKRRHGMA